MDRLVERARGGEGQCEFADEIAAAHPLRILSTILGVSREEEPRTLALTTQLFASDDPDLQREGEDRLAAAKALAIDFFQMFNEIIEDRNYMKRVVGRDLEFRGQKLREGDNLVLFYSSANRDEEVFEDPFTFRVDREPNPHLAFGIGEHFCLGAHLARRSQVALLSELVGRLDSIELAGEPERIHSSFVVGLKKLPLRYRVCEAA